MDINMLKYRVTRNVMDTPEPKPRKSGLAVMNKTIFGSNTSLSSTHSSTGTIGRKKKQAPRPPIINNQDSSMNSISSSPNASVVSKYFFLVLQK